MTSSAIRNDRLVRPRHVVTAVLVAHDGVRWLPATLNAVKSQRRPVQRFVAVDTGSHDDTRELLERAVGASSVLKANREAGFGAGVRMATAAFRGAPGLPSTRSDSGDVVDWIWLLHDDSAPAPNALGAMLELADQMPSVAVIGAKLRGWENHRELLEVGVTLDHGGRRDTRLEPGELDHGQHDGDHDVLAVSTAGMLVRRDVWDELGGFDPELPLFRDDVDFGWRANLAGHRVVICTNAIVQHAEAAASGQRPIACGTTSRTPGGVARKRRLDRQGALWTMLTNCSTLWLPWVALRLLVSCVLRAATFVVLKQPIDAWDELAAAVSIFVRPFAILRARRWRKIHRLVRPRDLRSLFAPRGTRIRHYVESARERISDVGRREDEVAGEGPGLARRVITMPGVLLITTLLAVSLVAQRHLLFGTLHGGTLLPAPTGASDLWHTYTSSWHDTGFGSTVDAPPYLAILAMVAAVLLGSAQLAVKFLLLGSVPIAGLMAFVAARRLTTKFRLRFWLATTYALLPVATGSVATGRLGTAVAYAFLPLVLSLAIGALVPPLYRDARAERRAARQAGRRVVGVRPAWSAALVLAIATAFEPLLYVLLLPLLATALVVSAVRVSWLGVRRAAVVLAVPPVLLLPWSARVWHHPALLVLGIGQPHAGLQAARLHPIDVLLLRPGGPGMPPTWLDAVVVLAALAGLLQVTRPGPALLGWLIALEAFVGGVLVARTHVHVPGSNEQLAGWPGIATAFAGAGLLMSVAVAGARMRARLTATNFGWRQPAAVLLATAATLTPVIGAATWISHGTGNIVHAGSPVLLPAFLVAQSEAHDDARTVVLRPTAGGGVEYALVRNREPRLGDADLPPDPAQVRTVDTAVSDLAAGIGQRAAIELAHAGIRYVLAPVGATDLAKQLGVAGGVLPQNASGAWRVWQVESAAGRLAFAAGGSDEWQLPADPVGVGRHAPPVVVPFSPAGQLLVLAEAPSPQWQAHSGGTALAPTTVAEMQAFVLPRTATAVTVSRAPDRRADWLLFQLGALLVVLLGAVPAGRRAAELPHRTFGPLTEVDDEGAPRYEDVDTDDTDTEEIVDSEPEVEA